MRSALLAWLHGRRILLLAVIVVLAANASIAIGACSSSNLVAMDDQAGDSGPFGDSGGDGLAPPNPPPPGLIDSGKPGNCSAVKGACDIVAQNCPVGQECVVVNGPTTQCVPVSSSEQLDVGHACCPPTGTQGNPCLPGLSCIGTACVDGGAPSGRCSPPCCKGDDKSCGKSDPEGIAGACDLTIVDPMTNQELYQTCSYQERCVPFGIEACKPGDICLVEDKLGSTGCLSSNGKTNRQPCGFANDCADGYLCLTTAADAGECRMECLTPSATTPFDAGGIDGGPLTGGCLAGEQCTGLLDPSGAPAWLSFCTYPDGG